ncbi:hypothetical protein EMWEY_00025300 [Eimeria maxima]|uniref:Uncharacterized protein n=1 Tax=Eimeria maxima TaxID=5804 RepID=U6M6I5_EIMMA|nr:hypothetical protein EMWEY_00025300 [Eimeria maxima]CDJ59847.1 hypothetical protein EMWEY_00025300 [Eimeria maxima]
MTCQFIRIWNVKKNAAISVTSTPVRCNDRCHTRPDALPLLNNVTSLATNTEPSVLPPSQPKSRASTSVVFLPIVYLSTKNGDLLLPSSLLRHDFLRGSPSLGARFQCCVCH